MVNTLAGLARTGGGMLAFAHELVCQPLLQTTLEGTVGQSPSFFFFFQSPSYGR